MVQQNKKILIAEDNSSNFKLIQFILAKRYTVIHANNGAEALQLFKEQQPDLILMDVSMPVMDGYESTEEIRKLSSTVPIVGLTAYAYATDRERGIKCGMNEYMTKPIIAEALRSTIIRLLNE